VSAATQTARISAAARKKGCIKLSPFMKKDAGENMFPLLDVPPRWRVPSAANAKRESFNAKTQRRRKRFNAEAQRRRDAETQRKAEQRKATQRFNAKAQRKRKRFNAEAQRRGETQRKEQRDSLCVADCLQSDASLRLCVSALKMASAL
jgi:hypothetical protein